LQHPAPVALGAVGTPLVPAPTRPGLDERGVVAVGVDVVPGRPPARERRGEDGERLLRRGPDGDGAVDGGERLLGVHGVSSLSVAWSAGLVASTAASVASTAA